MSSSFLLRVRLQILSVADDALFIGLEKYVPFSEVVAPQWNETKTKHSTTNGLACAMQWNSMLVYRLNLVVSDLNLH
jgi:hypothetical protein